MHAILPNEGEQVFLNRSHGSEYLGLEKASQIAFLF